MQNLRRKIWILGLGLLFGGMIALGLRSFNPGVSQQIPTPPPRQPEIQTGIPVGIGQPQNLAKIKNCFPPVGTETAAFHLAAAENTSDTSPPLPNYRPPQIKEQVHPTNFGNRFRKDAKGKPLQNRLLVVLHETVGDATGAVNTFQNEHLDDNQQVSYHAVVARNGKIIYLVDPKKRAFGAGNSEFVGVDGPEAVQTNLKVNSSVNNFAYHISLETPEDGWMNENPTHSGYTDAQYRSMAWLIARTEVPDSRITTHQAIDRLQWRQDPRSFSFPKLLSYLNDYPRPEDIAICPGRSQGKI